MRRANGLSVRNGKQCRPLISQITRARRAEIASAVGGDTIHIWAVKDRMRLAAKRVWPRQSGISISSNITGNDTGGGPPPNAG